MISDGLLRSAARALNEECEAAAADPEASRRVILASLVERYRRRTQLERGVTVAMFGLAATVGLWRHPAQPREGIAEVPTIPAAMVASLPVAASHTERPHDSALASASIALATGSASERHSHAGHVHEHHAAPHDVGRPLLREPTLMTIAMNDRAMERPIEATDVLHPTWNTRERYEIARRWNLRDSAARSARIIAMDTRAEHASVPMLDPSSPSGLNLNPVTLVAWR